MLKTFGKSFYCACFKKHTARMHMKSYTIIKSSNNCGRKIKNENKQKIYQNLHMHWIYSICEQTIFFFHEDSLEYIASSEFLQILNAIRVSCRYSNSMKKICWDFIFAENLDFITKKHFSTVKCLLFTMKIVTQAYKPHARIFSRNFILTLMKKNYCMHIAKDRMKKKMLDQK